MPSFKRRVERAIGAFKYDEDSWGDVLDRVNKESGMDMKIVYKVLGCILEEIDAKENKERKASRRVETSLPSEKGSIHAGPGEADEKIPSKV